MKWKIEQIFFATNENVNFVYFLSIFFFLFSFPDALSAWSFTLRKLQQQQQELLSETRLRHEARPPLT